MPIWLRKYHIRRIKDWFEKQNPEPEQKPPPDKPLGPGVKSMKNYTGKTNYTMKAPTK